MNEVVNTRGEWRRFPGGIELDRQNMNKAEPLFMTFLVSVLEESILSVILL